MIIMTIEEMNKIKTELGFSYAKIAEISGLPLSTVQKVLGGITKSPRYETLKALEKALCPVTETSSGRSSSSPKKQGDCTVSDYLNMPDDIRVELIDGVIYDMGAPVLRHQAVIGLLHYLILQFIREHDGSCVPFVSPVDVQLDCDEKTMVQPDVLIVCDPQKFRNGRIFGAPDFVAEVVSPSSVRRDNILKLHKYSDANVKEYWIVDPATEKVIVYDLRSEYGFNIALYTFEDKVPMNLYDGELVIDFTEIKCALQKLTP